jgi:3-oxoacyl-[acyl-carrier-protein] synthase II
MTEPRKLAKAIAIHSIGMVSPWGVGAAQTLSTLGAGEARPAQLPPADSKETWPQAGAHWLPDFDARTYLGPKGVSYLNRMTQMAIIACAEALRGGPPLDADAKLQTGVVLGSRGGSMETIAEFVRSTYVGLPHMVSPMQFPNATMNGPAGQCAIWHHLGSVNGTVCAGDLTGLAALHYGSRMLRLGHAQGLLVGSVEEYAAFNAWAHQADPSTRALPFTEAAVMFGLGAKPDEGDPLAHLLGTRMRHLHAGGAKVEAVRQGLRAEIEALLAGAGCRASDLAWAKVGRWAGEAAAKAQSLALGDVAPGVAEQLQQLEPLPAQAIGHAHGAAVSLDLAIALAMAPVGLGLLTAVGETGQIGAVLVRTNRAFATQ